MTMAAPVGHAVCGFYGKIPARGDFVQSGLPRSFVEPWDAWIGSVLAASRELLGEEWLPAWLEAPVWRFALAAGICGPDAVLGLWMPSVDRAGRQFPLTLAAVAAGAGLPESIRDQGGFLAVAEEAGREAVATDLAPEDLARRVLAAAETPGEDPGAGPGLFATEGASWWTAGGPRVAAQRFTGERLPGEDVFARMLDGGERQSR